MTHTRSGAQAEEQAKAEQAKVNAQNARIAELVQMKSKVSNTKLKISLFLSKLQMGLSDYRDLKYEVGEETVVLIQINWPELEATENALQESNVCAIRCHHHSNCHRTRRRSKHND